MQQCFRLILSYLPLQLFAEELANGKKIRLIYMGMLLLPSRTMGEYGIEENGVIHSVITDARKCWQG